MEKALDASEVKELIKPRTDWKYDESGRTISREFKMKNFLAAVELIDSIAKVAEEANHHPDIHLTGYRNLRVELTTHDAGGVSLKDIDEAGRIDALPARLKQ